jgi:hypothetical protein
MNFLALGRCLEIVLHEVGIGSQTLLSLTSCGQMSVILNMQPPRTPYSKSNKEFTIKVYQGPMVPAAIMVVIVW